MKKILSFLLLIQIVFSSELHIIDKPIMFDNKRVELTKQYIMQHYGIETNNINITPKIILLHWSATPTLEKTFERFYDTELLSDRTDISNAGNLNVSAQFIVDRDGSIYRLMPETYMARHVIGLNYNSIGIENVGGEESIDNLTQEQVEANIALIKYLKNKYETIEYIIGHHQYRELENTSLWLEIDKDYRTKKDDPGDPFVNKVKEGIKDLNLKGAEYFAPFFLIKSNLFYLLFVAFFVYVIVTVHRKYEKRFFKYVPSVVFIYIIFIILGSSGVFAPELKEIYTHTKNLILPMLIFLMLLNSNLGALRTIGRKTLLAYILATITIMSSFIIMWLTLHELFEEGAHKAFGALAGSWMGGTANMIAVASAIGVDEHILGYTLISDTSNYTIMLIFLLWIVPFAPKFNRRSGASNVIYPAPISQESIKFGVINIFMVSLVVGILIYKYAAFLPTTSYLSYSLYIVLIATIVGVIASFTPLKENDSSHNIGMWLLYYLIALIGSMADISYLTNIHHYIFAGTFVLVIYIVIMVLFAKIFKLDLFSLGIATLANLGGVASSVILASSYNKNLIGIGVILAMVGYIVGTFGGLFVAYILELI